VYRRNRHYKDHDDRSYWGETNRRNDYNGTFPPRDERHERDE
jgi:hypothetical protein